MKAIPTDPFELQARVFGALCDDLFDIGAGKSRSLRRTDALREISRNDMAEQAINLESTPREAGCANNAPASNHG